VAEPAYQAAFAAFDQGWGTVELARIANPEQTRDEAFLSWYARYQRASCTRSGVLRFLEQWASLDVRAMLPLVSIPVVVISRNRTAFGINGIEAGRYMADRIPGARFIELAGEGGVLGPSAIQLLAPLEELLGGGVARPTTDRVLATVVFTDIVDSTGLAATLGDSHWRRLLDAYDEVVEHETDSFGGRFVKSTGDGSLLTFGSPTAALRAARAIELAVREQGLSIRAGAHTGEIELRGDDIAGIGVHIAQRVSACASAGEVVVSSTVKDLLTGSDIDFADRGEHHLKGVPHTWRLFAVAS
jgi:class 3 adenylate cyclase